ncbi:lipid A-modifier LpxR family protein [Marinibacterium sp. SX1]|uniref:lipid A-modifier LpxR family protein n=1 Tax=Marinibacterium sp. SX1 TaxID=3388424 RepID=UPI003D1853A1
MRCLAGVPFGMIRHVAGLAGDAAMVVARMMVLGVVLAMMLVGPPALGAELAEDAGDAPAGRIASGMADDFLMSAPSALDFGWAFPAAGPGSAPAALAGDYGFGVLTRPARDTRAKSGGTPGDVGGTGWLLTNDALGDRADRWRSGSFNLSHAFRMEDALTRPAADPMWELRFQAQVIQPDNLTRLDPDDRPYAGVVSLGLHRHSFLGANDLAIGGDLVMIGPRTEMDDVQSALHDVLGGPQVAPEIRANQIGNRLRPTAVFEYGRRIVLGDNVTLRPFAEARLGDESLARLGADLLIGVPWGGWDDGLPVRDSVTGHRYAVGPGGGSGLSLVLGADSARVADSVYLPGTSPGAILETRRDRLRAGVNYRQGDMAVFYGMTWLGPEFTDQPDPQVLGSLQLRLRF